MSKEWDRENMKVMTVKMKKEAAERFSRYAAATGTTAGALLRGFAESVGTEKADEDNSYGVPHMLTYKNTDLLKAEAAHHNPEHLNPEELLNKILDDYFAFVAKVRK